LKAVADPDDALSLRDKVIEGSAQFKAQLIAQILPAATSSP